MKKKITIGILAHVDAGKTTLSEALLYASGIIRTLGRVDHKNTFLDTNAVERERGITVFSKQARFSTENCDYILLDTPGHVDFSPEAETAQSKEPKKRVYRATRGDYATVEGRASSSLVTQTKIGGSTESPIFFYFLSISLEISRFRDIHNGLVLLCFEG